jgi:hypothetical protein
MNEKKIKFYSDIKSHISPSALATWHNSKSGFIKSYFKGERTPETQAMKAGTKIHALIEAGFLESTNKFAVSERDLIVDFKDTGITVLGRPDSYEIDYVQNKAKFVDYKSGKENHWTEEELANDLKMRLTAWLIWKTTNEPYLVDGIIEWIGTEWNGTELVPTGERYCVAVQYTDKELRDFEKVIQKTIDEVNAEYERFLESSTKFVVQDDINSYNEIFQQIEALEDKLSFYKEKIAGQLEFGGARTFSCDFGTFSFRERKEYEYPKDLKIGYKDITLTLEAGEQIEKALSVVKKNFELNNDPVRVTKTLGFTPKRKKNGYKKY